MPPQTPSPLATLDAVGHAELVRKGEATPRELVDAAIARIEKENPELNAVIHPSFEKARAQASAPGLPHGRARHTSWAIPGGPTPDVVAQRTSPPQRSPPADTPGLPSRFRSPR